MNEASSPHRNEFPTGMPQTIPSRGAPPELRRTAIPDKPGGKRTWIYGILTVIGLLFWFALGFPFAHHNESYEWAVQLDRMNLRQAMTQTIKPVVTFRPLGQALAWLSYHADAGRLEAVQLLNFGFTALAWLALFTAIPTRKTFAVLALAVNAGLFSGYIYLFHLHGVFYGPLFLFLASGIGLTYSAFRLRSVIYWSALIPVVCLIHPFALPLGAALLAGLLAERNRLTPATIGAGLALMAGTGALVPLFWKSVGAGLDWTQAVSAGLTTYRMLEARPAISVLVIGLTAAAALSLPLSRRNCAWLAAACALGGGLLRISGQPALFLWIAVCLVKSLLRRRWSLALTLPAAAALPVSGSSGSPTYGLFAVMVCTAITAEGWDASERRLPLTPVLWIIPAAALAMAAAVRAGVNLPVVSRAALPILAEKEKTWQLDRILREWPSSSHRDDALAFAESREDPVRARNALQRAHRPPTSSEQANLFLNALRSEPPHSGRILWVRFGDAGYDAARSVRVLHGRWAGDATVSPAPPSREP